MTKRYGLLGLVLAMVLAGAAQAAPLKPRFADLAYGPDGKQTLDVYVPAGARNAPILVMVHGGGWRIGDKNNRGVVGAKGAYWLAKGFLFVSVNYRLLPDADVSAQAGDVASALAYVEAHAAAWGADPAKMVVMGHSAGAHLVALLSADPELAAAKGAKPWAGTVVLDSAALSVEAVMDRKHYALYDDAFGSNRDTWRALSPIVQLTAAAPPMLLVCSSVRADKPCVEAHAFAEKAHGLGLRAEVSEQALSHRNINVTLGEPSAYTNTVDGFIASVLN